ncbi:MAG: DUF3108 domain-containing protein [Rhodoferax sp.]|nr:MAG: DUF3108 domain-containing protein [Rhodoferax sp.]
MSTDSPPPPGRSIRAGLSLALVLGGHWLVLGATTSAWSGTPWPQSDPALVFESRILPTDAPVLIPESRTTPRRTAGRTTQRPATARTQTLETGQQSDPTPSDTTPAPEPTATQVAAVTVTEDTPAALPKPQATVPTSLVRTPILPESVRLLYDIKGEIKRIPVSANGELLWRQDGKTYDARLEISIFLLGSRVQTSKGLIGPQGLEPVRFGDKVRSEVAAHFERGKGKVTYSANTPDEVLQAGAQDQLSIFFQLAGMVAADPDRYTPGNSLSFQAVGPRSSEVWTFKLAAPEFITLPGGKVRAIRLSKDPVSEYDSRAEVWLAPELGYLPVRIRLTQGNGDVVDQLWRATERPKPSP